MRRLIYLYLLGRETPIFDLLVERPEELKVVETVGDDLNWKAMRWYERCLSHWMTEDEEAGRKAERRSSRFLKLLFKLQELNNRVEEYLGVSQDEDIPF